MKKVKPNESEKCNVIGYVTVAEADNYIHKHYLTTDSLRKAWDILYDDDKEILLRKSFQIMELLPYTGRKTCCEQKTAFPRFPHHIVPIAIKQAQIENALSSADASNNEDSDYYQKLWMWGVSSYSIGNLSESISQGSYGTGSSQSTGIVSAVAIRLLKPFINGGYNIL